jgi:hypothetical protein
MLERFFSKPLHISYAKFLVNLFSLLVLALTVFTGSLLLEMRVCAEGGYN